MDIIDLGTNISWNRLHSFSVVARPRDDPDFPGRIPDVIRFVEEHRLIVTVGHAGIAKPWWITAGRVIIEANFQFDAISGLGGKLVLHQQQLLLDRANLIYLPEYIFPYELSTARYRLTFHFNKWLKGINTEIFEYDN